MKKLMSFFVLLLLIVSVSSKNELFAQTISKDTVKVYDIYSEDKDFTTPENRVYDMVEVAAKFPGGQDSLWAYIQANKTSSIKNTSKNDDLLILVKCIIEKDGCVSNAKILLSMDHNSDNEALRIVNSMPRWQPAQQDGKPLRSFMTIPFRF